jgi:hypothetical protein
MAFLLSVRARKLATNAIVGAVDSGSTNSTGALLIYSGSQPATPESTATGTLLVAIPFESPAFNLSDSTACAGLAGYSGI